LVVEPELWGYSHLQVGEESTFVPLPNTTLRHSPPFKLHLIGSGGVVIPPELKNIVITHGGINYTDFYTLLGEMDVCLPAFSRSSDAYYVYQASSVILKCYENNVRGFGSILFLFPATEKGVSLMNFSLFSFH
jgi:radical SAM superfamily enzyme YgiQ (UPF0313 family)